MFSRAPLSVAGVLTFLAVLYLLQLGAGSLWDNSEPTYGEIVKELFRTGDWLTLHYDYAAWFVHPPLWFWTAGASVAAFGLTEFALRLPSAAFGVLTGLATYLAGRRLYGHAAGLVAALAGGACLEMLVLSRLAILDEMLVFFASVALFWGYFAARDGDRRAFWIAVVAGAIGTLVKGPIAVALPVLILIAWAAWGNSWRRLARLPWLAGTAAYVVLGGWWFALEAHLHGSGYLTQYFLHSNVGRALAPFENQPGPWWFYVPVLAIGFYPFAAYLPWSVVHAWRARSDDGRFLILAVAVPFVFFSLAQTKLPNYIDVMFPALGVLVGAAVADAARQNRLRPIVIGVGVVSLVQAAFVAAASAGQHELSNTAYAGLAPALLWLAAIMALMPILATAGLVMFRRPWIATAGLCGLTLGFVAVSEFAILPGVEVFKPMKAMAATVMALRRPGDRLGTFETYGAYSLLFYSDAGPVTFVGFTPEDTPPQRFFAQNARLLVVTSPRGFQRLGSLGYHLRALRGVGPLLLVTNR